MIIKLPHSGGWASIAPWAYVGVEVEGVELTSVIMPSGEVSPTLMAYPPAYANARDLGRDGPVLNRGDDLYDSDGVLKSERRHAR